MRKIFFIFCAAVLLAGCSLNKKTYTVNGVLPDSLYNGKWVYMIDDDQDAPLDSALVTDGKFSFTGTPDEYSFVRLYVDRKLFANIIREAGEITVDWEEHAASGTLLNDQLLQYSKDLKDFYQSEETSEKSDSVLTVKFNTLNESYFLRNTGNSLGMYVFMNWFYTLEPDKIDSLYTVMGDSIKLKPALLKIMEANERQKQTAVGKMFTDFTIEHGNLDSTAVSFSDYIGKGKYVLVDFWASWCGPCLREIPVIAEVYQKYKGDKFDVLGVAVWDEREKTLEAVKKHKIVWSKIIDAGEIPTKLYGINGIPQIILFAPDGTIVARNLRGDGLKAKVAEVLQ